MPSFAERPSRCAKKIGKLSRPTLLLGQNSDDVNLEDFGEISRLGPRDDVLRNQQISPRRRCNMDPAKNRETLLIVPIVQDMFEDIGISSRNLLKHVSSLLVNPISNAETLSKQQLGILQCGLNVDWVSRMIPEVWWKFCNMLQSKCPKPLPMSHKVLIQDASHSLSAFRSSAVSLEE